MIAIINWKANIVKKIRSLDTKAEMPLLGSDNDPAIKFHASIPNAISIIRDKTIAIICKL